MGIGKQQFRLAIFSLLGAVLFFVCSCASSRSFTAVDDELEKNQYAASIEQLEKNKTSLYKNRDIILYYLDKGMLSHYAQLYAESSELLQEGERAIEAAFTTSISQEISTFLINDTARDYSGEDYEDIYLNAFNALNYYHRGEYEGALVEIRRMNNKLQLLTNKYDVFLSDLQKKALEEHMTSIPPNPTAAVQFSDSALARYLGMLFYRSAGLSDNARIDRDWLLAAFANMPAVYSFPAPSTIAGELEIPQGRARLNVLAFAGLSPVKEEHVIRLPLFDGSWIKIALPEMKSRRSDIASVQLVMDSGQSFELELLEDIDAVAKATFSLREQVIYLKTIIRATIKGISSTALNIAAEETDGDTSLLLKLFSIFAQIFAEASERADIRMSRYFPAKAYVTGINLPPGRYSFQIKYYGKNGREIASVPYQHMLIRENNLNLVETVCLK